MAISNVAYLREIRDGVGRFEPRVLHYCLVAPVEVVHERLRRRGKDATEWEYRRAAECCLAHKRGEFATHVNAADRDPDDIADELRMAILAP